MRLDHRKVLIFFLQFSVLFVLMLVVYLAVLQFYQPVVLGAANLILERLEPPTRMEIDLGEWRAYDMDRNYKRVFMLWERWVPHLIFLGLPLLSALLLATPAPYVRRLQLVAIVLGPLFVLQVLSIVWIVRGNYTLMFVNPESLWSAVFLRLAYMSGQIFAAVLWALLTWRYWFTGTPTRPAPPAQPAASS